MRVAPHTRVTIRIETTVEGAAVQPPQTMSFIYGLERLLPGLDRRLAGLAPGELAILELQPFGERRDDLVTRIAAADVPEAAGLAPGQWHEVRSISGEELSFRLLRREGDELICDFNHPNAGRTLVVTAHVLEVHPATPEELLAASQRCASG